MSDKPKIDKEALKQRFQEAATQGQETQDDSSVKKFEAFHALLFGDISRWAADFPEVACSEPIPLVTEKSRTAGPHLKSFSMELTHPGLHPLVIKGASYNKIEFRDAQERALLSPTTREKNGNAEHDLQIFTTVPDPKDRFGRRRISKKLAKLWSEEAFSILMEVWLEHGRK